MRMKRITQETRGRLDEAIEKLVKSIYRQTICEEDHAHDRCSAITVEKANQQAKEAKAELTALLDKFTLDED